MSKLVNLKATKLGDEITLVDLYHTSVQPENLISASFSASLLLNSGASFVVDDTVSNFLAVVSHYSGSTCFGKTGSLTMGVYNPITRWLYFFTSGSDEGGSISMSYPFAIASTTSSFTASVNFNDYATATVTATGGTGFDDRFEGWYYSSTSSYAFSTGSTLTLTNTTFTGSDKIYAWFKDIELVNGWAFTAGEYTSGSTTFTGIHKGTLLTECAYSQSVSQSTSQSVSQSVSQSLFESSSLIYSSSLSQSISTSISDSISSQSISQSVSQSSSESISQSISQSALDTFSSSLFSTFSSSISCSLISDEDHGTEVSPTTDTTVLPGTNTYFLNSQYYLKGAGIDGLGNASNLALTQFDSASNGDITIGIVNTSGTGNPGSGSLSGSIYGSDGTSGSWEVIYSSSTSYVDQNGTGSTITPEATGFVTMSGLNISSSVTYRLFNS